MAADDYEVRFIYRVFNKTTEGGQLEEIKDKVTARHKDCVFTEGSNTYWPVNPADVQRLRERAILLTERDGEVHLVTQEVVGSILQDNYEDAEITITDLQTSFPGEFACVQIISNWTTEVFAR